MSNKMVISIYHGGIAMLGVLSCIYRYFFSMSDRALLEILLLSICSDIVFGLLKAAKKGVLSSAIMRAGLIRKACEVITVAVLCRVDKLLSTETVLHWTEPYLSTFFTVFFIIDELVSIVENLTEAGVKVPDWVDKSLMAVQKAKSEGVPSWLQKMLTTSVSKQIEPYMGSRNEISESEVATTVKKEDEHN